MNNTSATKNRPIKLTFNIKEKKINPIETKINLEGAYQNDWSKKDEADKMNDYLNEKLSYFYNNGGPIMDI